MRAYEDCRHSIALDDYVANDRGESMVPLADIIKVAFERTTPGERADLVKRHGGLRCRLLVESIETAEQFQVAQDAGFVYFQGYFFRRPEVMKTREIPANRVNYLRMLEAVSRPDMDTREVEGLIKQEASVLYRLLPYLKLADVRL